MSNEVKCPKCGSHSLSANKKGFSGKKAVAGAVLTGGVGLLAGTIGSNKIKITCLNCGNEFAPGDQIKQEQKMAQQQAANAAFKKNPTGTIIFIVAVFAFFIWLLKGCF